MKLCEVNCIIIAGTKTRWNLRIMEESSIIEDKGEGTPVCIRCMEPVDPLGYYCPNCGEPSGQLTQYIPFVNLRWLANTWGRMWRQIWSKDISIPGRIFRIIMITWNVPLILIGLLFKKTRTAKKDSSI